jgi:DNA polymerase I-like protein with 3'-5' exonuclease and polymerase domains
LGKRWPECQTLARHGEIQKVIGMLAEGKTAYLKMVTKEGRIHGRVVTNGAVTGRCAHKTPNLGNIPRRSELGKRVRALFTAIPGYRLVGSDAKGLELRALAHYLGKYDDGAYAKIVLDGDVHAYHQELAGLATRDQAKTFIYGFIYGAGAAKIGLIIGKGATAGTSLKLKFLKKFPALNALKNAVSAVAKQRKYLIGLDGRHLHVRAVYSALNTLLQSAGAIAVKQWTVLLNREIRQRGWYQDGSVRQVCHVHDEVLYLVKEGLESEFQKVAETTMTQAGEHFKLKVRLDAETKVGKTWGEVH